MPVGATREAPGRPYGGTEPPRPSFFIVGAPKCGTTALSTYLRRHPEICLPDGYGETASYEPMFFGSDLYCPPERRLTLDGYLALFSHARGGDRIGECSTRYLISKRAAREIERFEPDARIIVMLREPVEMMHSLHAQLVYSGEEPIADFELALADYERRRRLIASSDPPPISQLLAYRDAVRYDEQVERFFSTFGRERVHVIVFEDLIRDIPAAYARVLEFLGLEPGFEPGFEVVNEHKGLKSERLHELLVRPPRPVQAMARHLPRVWLTLFSAARELNTSRGKRPAISPGLRLALQAEVASDIRRLEDLLGHELPYWRAQ